MAWYDKLLEQGYVPAGTTGKVIPQGEQEAGYYKTDPVSRLLRSLQSAKIQREAKTKKALEDNKKKLDIYKTLREQGYDPAKAYKAAMESSLPLEAPGESLAEQNDVIKKQQQAQGEETVDDILSQKDKVVSTRETEMIPVYSPDGQAGFVPRSKLAIALSRGFKRRTVSK